MRLFNSLKNGMLFKKSVRGAFESLHTLWRGEQEGMAPELKALLVLIGAVAWADGDIDTKELESIRDILPDELSLRQGSVFLEKLKIHNDQDISDALEVLIRCGDQEKLDMVATLTKVAFAKGIWNENQLKLLQQTATAFGIADDTLLRVRQAEESDYQRRERILRSGAGVLVALVIISIFILTATFLKAVLFGFILSYLFLPLEKYFERRFRNPGTILRTLCGCSCILAPLYRISGRIKKSFGGDETFKTLAMIEEENLNRCVGKAVAATISFLIMGGLILFVVVSTFSANYLAGISSDLKHWADRQVATERQRKTTVETEPEVEPVVSAPSGTSDYLGSLVSASIHQLEEYKTKIEQWPFIQHAVSEITNSLKDSSNQKALVDFILRKTGGMFSFTADFLSNFVTVAFHSLMTLFFFLLFLQKMALYTARRQNHEGISEYVVKSIFESSWMPSTGDETRIQARRIIESIGMMLKTWLRGYLSIIAIEASAYILVFHLLGVPYATVLGFLAGCTILLPYIGPVGSAILTLLVTLALGTHSSVLMLLAIVFTYIVITGIVDQFFIYPAFVGEALGLTRLETISVVLLGGVFAGLSGMIFAVPAASVLKFLVPKIYDCWRPRPALQ